MPVVGAHGEAEAETVAGRHQRRVDLDVRAEVIRRHQFQRLAADDPGAVQRAAAQQHLAEPRIVHRGRDQPAAAGFHHRLFQHVEELDLVAVPGIDREGLGEAAGIGLGGVERGLVHLQRRQDPLGQERAERLAGDDFDDPAEHVGRAAVVPFGARLAHQRHAGDDGGVFGVADLAAAQPRLLVQLLHRAVAGVVVSQPRGVPQQVLHRHRPLHRHEFELAVDVDADLLIRKLRNELGDGVVEDEVAVLDQHHDANRDDRLGHREDPEQAVMRHRRRGGRALPADGVEPADLAAAGHHHGRAGQGALVDLALEGIRHPLQARAREPDRLGFGVRERGGLGGGCLASGGGLRVHGLSRMLIGCWWPAEVWPRSHHLDRVVGAGRSASPLQSGHGLCLKRREPALDDGSP